MKFNRRTENLIAAFRGLPPDDSRSIVRDAWPVDSLVEVILEKYRVGQPKPEEALMQHWREIVGEKFAHRCSPRRLRANGELTVAVANPVLRRELLFDRAVILKTIQNLPGCEAIQSVVFVAG